MIIELRKAESWPPHLVNRQQKTPQTSQEQTFHHMQPMLTNRPANKATADSSPPQLTDEQKQPLHPLDNAFLDYL